MIKKDKSIRDPFTLSLGGMTTVTSYAAAPAIEHDRLRKVPDGQARDARVQGWRLWIPRRSRVA